MKLNLDTSNTRGRRGNTNFLIKDKGIILDAMMSFNRAHICIKLVIFYNRLSDYMTVKIPWTKHELASDQ